MSYLVCFIIAIPQPPHPPPAPPQELPEAVGDSLAANTVSTPPRLTDPLSSTTINFPRYIPILQENGISPVCVGVNSIMFSPFCKSRLMPYFGITKDEAQEKLLVDVIIHFTRFPFSTTN